MRTPPSARRDHVCLCAYCFIIESIVAAFASFCLRKSSDVTARDAPSRCVMRTHNTHETHRQPVSCCRHVDCAWSLLQGSAQLDPLHCCTCARLSVCLLAHSLGSFHPAKVSPPEWCPHLASATSARNMSVCMDDDTRRLLVVVRTAHCTEIRVVSVWRATSSRP